MTYGWLSWYGSFISGCCYMQHTFGDRKIYKIFLADKCIKTGKCLQLKISVTWQLVFTIGIGISTDKSCIAQFALFWPALKILTYPHRHRTCILHNIKCKKKQSGWNSSVIVFCIFISLEGSCAVVWLHKGRVPMYCWGSLRYSHRRAQRRILPDEIRTGDLRVSGSRFILLKRWSGSSPVILKRVF